MGRHLSVFAPGARRAGLLLGLLCLLGQSPALAQEAEVHLVAANDGVPWAGEQVTLYLDLKTNDLSFADVFFDLPEVPGAFLLRTDSNTIKLGENRAGERWQGLRYPLALFAPRGGTVSVPAFEVRFKTSKGFGSEPTLHRLMTAPLTLTVREPPGVGADDIVVSSPGFELNYEWTLPPDPAAPGDALSLTIERRAESVSAMLLPPVPVYEAPGLASYPAAPELENRSNRGQLVGARTDQITWIIEQPGSYQIPALRFRWWDPVREKLQDQIVDGVALEVAGDAGASASNAPVEPSRNRLLTGLILGAVLALILALMFPPWRTGAVSLWRRVLPPRRTLLKQLNPAQEKTS